MLFDLGIKVLMLLFGYFYASRLIDVRYHAWGIFAAIMIVFFLHLLQSAIAPWPFGIPLFLCAYIAMGVGCRSFNNNNRGI